MPNEPFADSRIDLGDVTLGPVDEETAAQLAEHCAAIDPWARMGLKADALGDYFRKADAAAPRRCVRKGGEIAGTVTIRYPWLLGPYLEFLAVFPGFQGADVGSTILDWIDSEASGRARNIWVLVSDFNDGARRFYERHGFEPVAPLPDLIFDGFTEVMLRKRLV